MRPRLAILALGLGLLVSPAWLWAEGETPSTPAATDELSGMFASDTPAEAQTGTTPSLLEAYNKAREKIGIGFDLYATGGEYVGWTRALDISDLAANFYHASLGTIYLKTSVDLRPYDYLRVHGSGYLTYPTMVDSKYDFGLSLREFFLDYANRGNLAVRLGRYSLSWGNARILDIADLPNRAIDTSDISDSVEFLPSWLTGSTPSLWLKAALPVGVFTPTVITGLPITTGQGLSHLPYGLLGEFSLGKTSLGLGGYYQSNRFPRLALMLKTSFVGMDVFLDSVLTAATAGPLFGATAGIFYQTSSGPEIKVTAETRWNGENPDGAALVNDAESIPGLSSALALAWSSVGGMPLSLGLSWYHSWLDGSGCVVPALSYSMARLVTLKAVFPWGYGAEGSVYRDNPPSEAGGVFQGLGVFLVLKSSFRK